MSPENAADVESETRIPLFSVQIHFRDDLIIKLAPGMGLDGSTILDPVACQACPSLIAH